MITVKHSIKYQNRSDKDLADFMVACVKLFDQIYDEEPILLLKESSSRSNGGYNKNYVRGMNITLHDMRYFSKNPFLEYYKYHWWATRSHNPYLGVYLFAVHEYSHIVNFSRHQFDAKAHGRKFYIVCQEVESSVSFDSCFTEFRKARIIF